MLAAGRGSRYGPAPKLLADLDGRPVLQHVLDAVAEIEADITVVVLGRSAADVQAAIRWRTERRVVNPDPGRGISSSVRLGLDTLETLGADLSAALILLGDQPLVSVAVMRSLLDAPADRPIVVPRYPNAGGQNPVVLMPAGWALASKLEGDRGFGPLIAIHPDLVRVVPVSGSNPDVDTPADLRALESG